jgi:hypothetical protein
VEVNDGHDFDVSIPLRQQGVFIDEREKTFVSQRLTNRASLGGGGQGRSADWKIVDVKRGMLQTEVTFRSFAGEFSIRFGTKAVV